jgi:hypothetical protein
MTDLGSRSSDIIGCVAGLRSVESHSAGSDVEKGGHDDAGVGNDVQGLARFPRSSELEVDDRPGRRLDLQAELIELLAHLVSPFGERSVGGP